MYLTGFADEAGASIDVQIAVTRELGWKFIEARAIQVGNGKTANIHDITDSEFDVVVEKLQVAGIRINGFGSAIANWSKKIEDPFDSSLAEIHRAIPRMKRLGVKMVRIMSFAVRDQEDQMEEERFRRLREIVKRFSDEGMEALHENCMNYGGMGWTFTLKLLENVPGLKLLFDTGNPVFTDDRTKPKPYPKQSSWEFYSKVSNHVRHIHIKDGKWSEKEKKNIYSYPDEGDGHVKKILQAAHQKGYDGGISIEPHLHHVFHDPSAERNAKLSYDGYVEYGRRMEKIVNDIWK